MGGGMGGGMDRGGRGRPQGLNDSGPRAKALEKPGKPPLEKECSPEAKPMTLFGGSFSCPGKEIVLASILRCNYVKILLRTRSLPPPEESEGVPFDPKPQDFSFLLPLKHSSSATCGSQAT